ncbi:MAG: FkbM family methyltransferase [Jannaschia sp.]
MRPSRSGIGRSLDVYYRDAARTERMDRLNAQFVANGSLAFDIGAHVGDRTASFLRLGASVVALEPQPRVFRALRLIHGRTREAVLRCEAVGATSGQIGMYLNSENPTISTASHDLLASAKTSTGWRDQVWDARIDVPVTTLDRLVAEHGLPDFMKIDVEGHEAEVLAGLTVAVPALSFEFTTIQRDVAYDCLRRLGELGPFEFNLSLGEDHVLRHRNWVSGSDMAAEIRSLPEQANSGDVYARSVRDTA